jgi:hypothetical protein
LYGLERRRPRAASRLRRRDLDSEGDKERSFFEQKPLLGLEAEAEINMRRGRSEPRNSEGVLRVRSSSGALRVFANKRDRPAYVASAVVSGAYTWGRR